MNLPPQDLAALAVIETSRDAALADLTAAYRQAATAATALHPRERLLAAADPTTNEAEVTARLDLLAHVCQTLLLLGEMIDAYPRD